MQCPITLEPPSSPPILPSLVMIQALHLMSGGVVHKCGVSCGCCCRVLLKLSFWQLSIDSPCLSQDCDRSFLKNKKIWKKTCEFCCFLISTDTRWFKVPFSSPSWRSLITPWKGHLTIPKRSLWITRYWDTSLLIVFFMYFLDVWYESVPTP